MKAESKAGEALAAYLSSGQKPKGGGKGRKGKSTMKRFNCGKLGHKAGDCYGPGDGKEGQGLCQRGQKGGKQGELSNSANVTSQLDMKDDGTMFAYAATSSFHSITTKLGISPECCSTIVDSGTTCHYCPNRSRFKNFTPISDFTNLTDGCKLLAIGEGDIKVTVPHGDKWNTIILR